MGTRNLTMVINRDGETKVAQYGQWDGYLEGQGVTILGTLHERLDLLEKAISKCRFMNEDDIKERKKFWESLGAKGGWVTMGQSEQYHIMYPLESRDIGGEILNRICDLAPTVEEIVLSDSSSFANDSLFCEFAYVIDFRSRTFEVYTGFVTEALDEKERFYTGNSPKDKYYPVKALMSFSLDALPSEQEFLSKGKELLKEEE